jgi:hypothetical protein
MSSERAGRIKFKFPRFHSIVSCLLAAGALFASAEVNAQWIVNDPPNTTVSAVNEANGYVSLGKQVTEMGETLARWQQTWSHYQQQISKMKSMANQLQNLQLPGQQTLSPVAEDFGVAEKCGSGFSLSGLKTSITAALSPKGSGTYSELVTEQRKVCAMIRTMENMKFNASVEFINSTMPTTTAKYNELVNTFFGGGILGQGDQDQARNSLLAASNDLEKQFNGFEEKIRQYDVYVQSLTVYQRTLGEMMLRGKGTNEVIGTVVQTAVMAKALGVDMSEIAP